jgi:prepilin-type processing-associated H-X9-DG protein
VTVADLNQDGHPDLAVACSTAHKVGVLLGTGDGTFGHVETYDTDGEPSAVVVADFNLDGVSELAVSDYQIGGGKTVSLYQGNGDGTFRARTPFQTALGPLGLAVADLNRDGRPDIVTADFHDSVSVLLATEKGFEEFRKLQAGKANGFVATGDFDDDGFLDLVVTGEHSNSAHILFGDGRGRFEHSELVATGKYPDAIAVGDFNRDGKMDFAVANTLGSSISVFVNQSGH